MDLGALITQLRADGTLPALANRPTAQFGTPARTYLGAQLLPERPVNDNAYREEAVSYRTIIANAGTRYSPSQKKRGAIIGSFLVELGESDIASELTSREYDILLSMLDGNASMEAMAQIVNFAETTAVRPLLELNEKQRWEALVEAIVRRRGDNAYMDNVEYPNPAGHRAPAGGGWSDPTYDPFTDLYARAELLQGKGYTINRIITSTPVISIMAANPEVRTRVGLNVDISNRASRQALNDALAQDGLPAIETYDLQYRTNTGTGFFLKRDVMVLIATTGRDESLDLGDELEVVENTLGYTAIGRAAGQPGPGRVLRVEHFENKPPRIESEGWQTSLPVVLEPEAVAVITGIV
jgi:hypothetical protein